jgi:hypothetical protein
MRYVLKSNDPLEGSMKRGEGHVEGSFSSLSKRLSVTVENYDAKRCARLSAPNNIWRVLSKKYLDYMVHTAAGDMINIQSYNSPKCSDSCKVSEQAIAMLEWPIIVILAEIINRLYKSDYK